MADMPNTFVKYLFQCFSILWSKLYKQEEFTTDTKVILYLVFSLIPFILISVLMTFVNAWFVLLWIIYVVMEIFYVFYLNFILDHKFLWEVNR